MEQLGAETLCGGFEVKNRLLVCLVSSIQKGIPSLSVVATAAPHTTRGPQRHTHAHEHATLTYCILQRQLRQPARQLQVERHTHTKRTSNSYRDTVKTKPTKKRWSRRRRTSQAMSIELKLCGRVCLSFVALGGTELKQFTDRRAKSSTGPRSHKKSISLRHVASCSCPILPKRQTPFIFCFIYLEACRSTARAALVVYRLTEKERKGKSKLRSAKPRGTKKDISSKL